MREIGLMAASSCELRAARWVIVLAAICVAMGAGAQTAKERAGPFYLPEGGRGAVQGTSRT